MNWLFEEERTHHGCDELVKNERTVWGHTGDEKPVVDVGPVNTLARPAMPVTATEWAPIEKPSRP
jgi:hypothetical protein